MRTIKDFLKEGKEDLPEINKLKKERAKNEREYAKISTKLEKLEMSLSKYMDMGDINPKDIKDMRKVLANIEDMEEKLIATSNKRSVANKQLRKLLGL